MKYYLATSKRDKDFIIMREDLRYRWYITLPNTINDDLYCVGKSDTIDNWLSSIDANNMQLLASFDHYDVFKRDFPEYFI